MRMKRWQVIPLLAVLLWLCGGIVGATSPKVFVHEGTVRHYDIYVPESYDEETAMPLVMLLHGRGSTGEIMRRLTEMDRFAEEHGFIAVYPDGIAREWNYTRGQPWVADNPTDDTEFLTLLVEHLQTKYTIDTGRVYVAGLSNGGFMAQRLACEAPDTFAAFGAVAATGFTGLPELCSDTAPVPVMLIHGTADTIVPWAGHAVDAGGGQVFYISLPAPETLTFWAAHNGCNPDFAQETIEADSAADDTQVRLFTDAGCEARGAVTFYAVLGGGHTWPGVSVASTNRAALGRSTTIFHASDVLWQFFAQHTLSG